MNERKTQNPDGLKINRRQFIVAGASLAVVAGLPLASLAASDSGDRYQFGQLTLDGEDSPFPLPWLDKNGSHNQSPGPNSEPSSIYHFIKDRQPGATTSRAWERTTTATE